MGSAVHPGLRPTTEMGPLTHPDNQPPAAPRINTPHRTAGTPADQPRPTKGKINLLQKHQRPTRVGGSRLSPAGRLLLTPIEAAARLSISRTKIYELMAAGTLRSIHIGRLRRVPVDALREFVGALDSR